MSNREFDIIIYGASGFTGRLVAEYLQKEYAGSGLKWAMAGRNSEKLQTVAGEMKIDGNVAVVTANSDDPDSLAAMAARTNPALESKLDMSLDALVGTAGLEETSDGADRSTCDMIAHAGKVRYVRARASMCSIRVTRYETFDCCGLSSVLACCARVMICVLSMYSMRPCACVSVCQNASVCLMTVCV